MVCLWQVLLCHAVFYLLQVSQGTETHFGMCLPTVSSCACRKLQCNIYLY